MTKLDSTQLNSGRFWLPDAPDQHVGGWVDAISHWPEVTLADPRTPAMRETERTTGPDGRVTIKSVPADDDIDPDAFTVHASAAARGGSPWSTHQRGPQHGARRSRNGPGRAAAGCRLRIPRRPSEGADTLFSRARLRVGHLDEWAGLPDLSTTVAVDGDRP